LRAKRPNWRFVSVNRSAVAALGAVFLCALLPREAPAQAAPLKIGVIMSFSGPGASLGRSVNASLDAWLAMHHNTIGGRPAVLIRRDDAHAPETARRLAQELIVQDKIDILVGGSSTPEAVAMGEVSTQAKIPYFIINATSPGTLVKAPYAIRTSYLTPDFGPPLARWLVRNGIKTVYAVVADYSSGADTLSALTDAMAASGGKVIGSVAVPLNTTDFSSYLLRAKDAKPDALFAFVGGGPSSINIVKQFGTQGLKSQMKLIGTADLISEELMGAEGPDALGVVTASNYTVDHNSKLNRDFVRVYKQVIPNPTPDDAPTFISVQAFDALSAIDHAVAGQKGAIDPVKTIDALRGYTFESPRGPITIDAQTREVHENMYIRRTEQKNGTFTNNEIASYPPPK
jgi:branched-chain amino acid transport system substrate-binding protein